LGHAHCLGVSVEPADYAEHVPTEVGRAPIIARIGRRDLTVIIGS
jgi:hypothetical protein